MPIFNPEVIAMKLFKKAIRLIPRCVIFLLILALLLLATSYAFTPKDYWEKHRNGEVPVAHAVLNEPENSIDVLFVGDSLVYSAISPMDIWNDYGFTSFDCAGSAQQMFASEELLTAVLEQQKPKAVVFEPYSLFRKEKAGSKLAVQISSLFPVFTYHDRWKNIDEACFSGFFGVTNTDDFKGFALKWRVEKAKKRNYMKETDKEKEIPAYNEEYFESILNICEKAGTELILISVPSQKCWNYAKHNGIQELADKYGVEYVDLNLMNDRLSINWEKDTRDAGDHLNYYGAKKVSDFLGEYLQNRYSLPDHRSDRKYSQWNEALERYKPFVDAPKK